MLTSLLFIPCFFFGITIPVGIFVWLAWLDDRAFKRRLYGDGNVTGNARKPVEKPVETNR